MVIKGLLARLESSTESLECLLVFDILDRFLTDGRAPMKLVPEAIAPGLLRDGILPSLYLEADPYKFWKFC